MTTGIELIAAERQRQIEREGWTPQHDDEHTDDALARAAACYAMPRNWRVAGETSPPVGWPVGWDWKPDERIRELVKAGALVAAEIDRLQRQAAVAEQAVFDEQVKARARQLGIAE